MSLAASAVLGISQSLADQAAFIRRQRGDDFVALVRLELAQHEELIVGVHLRDGLCDLRNAELFDDLFPDRIVELGQDDRIERVAQQVDQHRPLFRVDLFEQVGEIGIVKRLGKRLGRGRIVLTQRFDDGLDVFGSEAGDGSCFGLNLGRSGFVRPVVHNGSSCSSAVWASTTASAVMLVMPRAVLVSCTT